MNENSMKQSGTEESESRVREWNNLRIWFILYLAFLSLRAHHWFGTLPPVSHWFRSFILFTLLPTLETL